MDLANLTLCELTVGFNDLENALGQVAVENPASSDRSTLRRCRTREQGIALLTISHAIEYLLDSRVAQRQDTTIAEREALAILLTVNLSVYRDGTEVVPFWSRLRQWFHGGTANHKSIGPA